MNRRGFLGGVTAALASAFPREGRTQQLIRAYAAKLRPSVAASCQSFAAFTLPFPGRIPATTIVGPVYEVKLPPILNDHFLRVIPDRDDPLQQVWNTIDLFDQGVYHQTSTRELMTASATHNECRLDDVNWEEKPTFSQVQASLDRLVEAGFMRRFPGDKLALALSAVERGVV